MLKRFGFPLLALVIMFMVISPSQANAEVRFRVQVGPAYPAYHAYGYAPAPYGYVDPYAAPGYYANPYPAYGYAAPSYGFSFFGGGHHDYDRHYYRGYDRGYRGGHEFREHEGYRGYRR